MKNLIPNRAEAKTPPHPEWFEGRVLMHTLVPQTATDDLEVLAVFFHDGARTRPHVHPVDQLLVGVEGRCVVATEFERIEIAPGQMALIPKGEWHWHGAVRHTDACHLSIKKPGATDWNQPLKNFNE